MANRQIDKSKYVIGLDSAVPSSNVPDYVSLRGFNRFTAIVLVKNATTVAGSAITLKQATSVAGAGEKTLAFARAHRNVDTGAGDALAEFAVAGDTFTTDATNSKNLMYVIEVDATELDVSNGFDCVRVGTGNATAATVTVLYQLSGARYGGNVAAFGSAIVD